MLELDQSSQVVVLKHYNKSFKLKASPLNWMYACSFKFYYEGSRNYKLEAYVLSDLSLVNRAQSISKIRAQSKEKNRKKNYLY